MCACHGIAHTRDHGNPRRIPSVWFKPLGWSLPGTVLFATKVLLVEGDSDPMLLNVVLQKLIELGRINFDVNSLSIISTGESKHADALIRMLAESALHPEIAAIFEGDGGGKTRAKNLKKVMEHYNVHKHILEDGTSIEDHILRPNPIFVSAVVNYVSKMTEFERGNVDKKVKESFEVNFGASDSNQISGLAKWSRQDGRRIAKLESDLSSLGIAREYAEILMQTSDEQLGATVDCERGLAIANWIGKTLQLPERTLLEGEILQR